jgi:hypothetical protein
MTFYLRTNGSNANDGMTPATAMLTFNALMLRIYREWDFCGYSIIIDVGEGTWTGETWTVYGGCIVGCAARMGCPGITISGKGRDKTFICPSESTVIGEGTARNAFFLDSAYITVGGIKIFNHTTAFYLENAYVNLYSDIEVGDTFYRNFINNTCQFISGAFWLRGNFSVYLSGEQYYLDFIYAASSPEVTLKGDAIINVNRSVIATANTLITIYNNGIMFNSFGGSFIGRKYWVERNGIITYAQYIPGTIAGVVTNGGRIT